MAKLHGILKLSGSIDELSYYKTKFGYVVRRKGGFNSKRLKKDKAYVRSRETASEFGNCSRLGKLIRDGFKMCIKQKGDQLLSSRLNSVLIKIKNLDAVSARGKRSVTKGLETSEGLKLLRGFDFNTEAHLTRILKRAVKVDTGDKHIKIKGLVPKKDLVFPKGASHFSITGGIARINPEDLSCQVAPMTEMVLALNGKAEEILLVAEEVLTGRKGFDLYFIGISFLQEVSGKRLALNNERYTAACILEIKEVSS